MQFILALTLVTSVAYSSPDQCVHHMNYKVWMEKLQTAAKSDDLIQFRKAWTAVCAEASGSCACSEEKTLKQGATAKMYNSNKPMESTFQINIDANDILLFHFGPIGKK